jgi:hypothetical protein
MEPDVLGPRPTVMSYRLIRRLLGGALVAALPLVAGCTATDDRPTPAPPAGAPQLRLVAFDSCAQLLTDLRRAARDAVGPYGLPGADRMEATDALRGGARTGLEKYAGPVPAAGAPAAAPAFSGTNNHERDADEPDLVKTDGKRIVVVDHGELQVIDAASRTRTGRLDLGVSGGETQLLLAGDHALVLVPGSTWNDGGWVRREKTPVPGAGYGAQVLLVDLTGTPRVLSRYRGTGVLLDARQTGTTARVVLRSTPRFDFRELPGIDDQQKRITANQGVVDAARADTWLPSYEVTTGRTIDRGQVGCDRVSRPTEYSGTSLVTVLSFDLAAAALGTGDPVSVVADGDTVYGTGTSLYIANDQRWRQYPWRGTGTVAPGTPHTELYRFDVAGTARPTYAATGTVPGRLVNQYALSEWNGHLRVATTRTGRTDAEISAIHVLRQQGGTLVETGTVDGLGKGERIYSVRFVGPRGYVVTFKQTDPLYSVDLADPAKPTVTGELKITGYSAHLQPVGDNRLVGIGQEADAQGRTRGTQLSLFDVADPARPNRLAQHQVAHGQSEAEYDPHALLWWPATKLLVVPLTVYDPVAKPTGQAPAALALRVTDAGFTEVGAINQPVTAERGGQPTIRRSLVVGDVLWTVSDAGLQASDLGTLHTLTWLPVA